MPVKFEYFKLSAQTTKTHFLGIKEASLFFKMKIQTVVNASFSATNLSAAKFCVRFDI